MSILSRLNNFFSSSYNMPPSSPEGHPSDPMLLKHREVIDSFIALGYDLDEITIRKGCSQTDALKIIESYGFNINTDRRRYKGTPQELINAFVDANFSLVSQGVTADFVKCMDSNIPNWRNATPTVKASMLSMHLSDEEKNIINEGYRKDND